MLPSFWPPAPDPGLQLDAARKSSYPHALTGSSLEGVAGMRLPYAPSSGLQLEPARQKHEPVFHKGSSMLPSSWALQSPAPPAPSSEPQLGTVPQERDPVFQTSNFMPPALPVPSLGPRLQPACREHDIVFHKGVPMLPSSWTLQSPDPPAASSGPQLGTVPQERDPVFQQGSFMLPAPPVPSLGPQHETARQEHDPVFHENIKGVPPAPVEAEIPMPFSVGGLQALLPGTGPPQAARAKKLHQHISTDGLTVEVGGVPEAWGESEVPDFVELLGVEKRFLRYTAICRMKDESRHAFVSFCSTELAQEFANALQRHVLAGTVGSLKLMKINERCHKRVEKTYFRVQQTTDGIRSSSEASYLTARTFWL